MILDMCKVVDFVTGNRISGAISWTYNVVANGTRVVKGTVPIPALLFLGYNLPTTINKIAKKLNIKVKDIPKLLLNQENESNIKLWRRI